MAAASTARDESTIRKIGDLWAHNGHKHIAVGLLSLTVALFILLVKQIFSGGEGSR